MNRQRGRRRNRADYRTPWLLREVYGAPVWGMILVAVVVVGIGVLYLSQH
ncbi:hypothetical protein [Microbacterium sp. 22242]